MSELYTHITKVVIKGEIRELTRIVTQLGQRMQDASRETEAMKSSLIKYMSSNLGKQYDKAAKAVLLLSEKLYSASIYVNNVRNDIAVFQNKSYGFDEASEYAEKPQPHLVQKAPVQVITTVFYFNRDDFLALANSIHKYCANIFNVFKILSQNVDEIGRIWVDPIYATFRSKMYDLIKENNKFIGDLEDYARHLDMKIKEYD